MQTRIGIERISRTLETGLKPALLLPVHLKSAGQNICSSDLKAYMPENLQNSIR